MSKLTKLIRHPVLFLRDAVAKKFKKGGVKRAIKAEQKTEKKFPKGIEIFGAIGFKKTEKAVELVYEDNFFIPNWYNSHPGKTLIDALQGDKPLFLYFSLSSDFEDVVLSSLVDPSAYHLVALDLVSGGEAESVRADVLRYARTTPHHYRTLVARRLIPLRGNVKGVLFSCDGTPATRMVADLCREMEIPRLLLPEDAPQIAPDQYYVDPVSLTSVPSADLIFGGGGLRRSLLIERGYPADRILTVGAPRFDRYKNHQPQLSREQYCRLFGLRPDWPILAFVVQLPEGPIGIGLARQSQTRAVSDLLDYAETHQASLLVRLPEGPEPVLDSLLRHRLALSPHAAIERGACPIVPVAELLAQAQIVASLNSPLLFEAVLLGRKALSMTYNKSPALWEQTGIPAVRHRAELDKMLARMLSGRWTHPEDGIRRAAAMLGVGSFDGEAGPRIRHHLRVIAKEGLTPYHGFSPSPLDRLLAGQPLDVVGIPSSEKVQANEQRYLKPLINARTLCNTREIDADLAPFAALDLVLQWGLSPSRFKQNQSLFARARGCPVAMIEDGFIRSVEIGLAKGPGLSILIDDTTAYYDATRPSRLQRRLQDGPELTREQRERAWAAIAKIVSSRVSKYNHAPDFVPKLGTQGRKKLLLLDQRFGDQSVICGLADETSFKRMLEDALKSHPEHDILIKQHPDAIKGGKKSYFSKAMLQEFKQNKAIIPISFDINPYALFDLVDEVYTVTSGMGFEALMAGKTVHCYGLPFYAGWGLTEDQIRRPDRTRRRTLEDLFHFAYIEASRYFSPDRDAVVEVEEIVDYIVKMRS